MKGGMTVQKLPPKKRRSKQNAITKIGFSFLPILLTFNFSLLHFNGIQIADADTETNGNYSVNVDTIDTNPQPTIKQKKENAQQTKPEFTTGPNYTVTTSNDSFSVTLSQNTIDYGVLSSTNPVIRTSDISFSNPKFGSEILGYENNPLQSVKNDTIQNTSCDNGVCSAFTAAVWNNTLTYGFGYRCDSQYAQTCDAQFSNSNYFKQYPNDSTGQLPALLMINYGSNNDAQGIITNKVNISGTQKTAGYYNSITYLAVPNF